MGDLLLNWRQRGFEPTTSRMRTERYPEWSAKWAPMQIDQATLWCYINIDQARTKVLLNSSLILKSFDPSGLADYAFYLPSSPIHLSQTI